MRNVQRRPANHKITEEENVQIQGSWAILAVPRAVAPKILFDEEQRSQQFERRQVGFERRNRIQKTGLIGKSHGCGGVEG